MSARTNFLVLLSVTCLAPLSARAGDPEAHSAAAIRAAKQVQGEATFSQGVGAPLRNGSPIQGRFPINTDGSDTCPYSPGDAYGVGCAYTSINGLAINEPDNWKCYDSRQPEKMNSVNSSMAPGQTAFATLLAARVSEVATVCNWNHFSTNPILPRSENENAAAAIKLTKDRAQELLDGIKENGGTETAKCDKATFDEYYRRTLNSLHYVQDQVCEDHDQGNLVCQNTEPVPFFTIHPLYNFDAAQTCMKFLAATMTKATGKNPQYWCDEAFMKGTRDNISLNANMVKVGGLCGFAPTLYNLEAGINITDPGSWDPVLSLACMGMERTLRHHCMLDRPKSISCYGPGNDHSTASSNQTYCEGEIYAGPGGQDFLSLATAASVPPLEDAMNDWATVCKEPDDPCDPAQCNTWCQRSKGKIVDLEPYAGYCTNASPDSSCVLHTCTCTFVAGCGGDGQPCCTTGAPCKDSANECGASTGTCVAKGTGACDQALLNGDFSDQLNHWKVVVVSGGQAIIDTSVTYPPKGLDCQPSQNGNPFVLLDIYAGDVYLSQTFTVPASATTLTLRTWNNLDAAEAIISVVSNGQETVLGDLEPPSMEGLSDPNDDYSVICTGNTPASESYDFSAFAGQSVELRLRGKYVSGVNGTFISYDDIKVQ